MNKKSFVSKIHALEKSFSLKIPSVYKSFLERGLNGSYKGNIKTESDVKKFKINYFFSLLEKAGLRHLESINKLHRAQTKNIRKSCLLIGETDESFYVACDCSLSNGDSIYLFDPGRGLRIPENKSKFLSQNIDLFINDFGIKPIKSPQKELFSFRSLKEMESKSRRGRIDVDGAIQFNSKLSEKELDLMSNIHSLISSTFSKK